MSEINTRRGFLKFLGIAPAAGVVACQKQTRVEAAPLTIQTKPGITVTLPKANPIGQITTIVNVGNGKWMIMGETEGVKINA